MVFRVSGLFRESVPRGDWTRNIMNPPTDTGRFRFSTGGGGSVTGEAHERALAFDLGGGARDACGARLLLDPLPPHPPPRAERADRCAPERAPPAAPVLPPQPVKPAGVHRPLRPCTSPLTY